jgi:acyl-CoA dehydrogenase
MKRDLYSPEDQMFQDVVRRWVQTEVVPHQERWRDQGIVDREAWRMAGQAGLLCPMVAEEYGGVGGTFLHSTIIIEELARAFESGFAISLHSDIVVPYIDHFGDDAQKKRWLPGCVSGEFVTALAMTEPGTGSDLAALRTSAVRDGDDYIINGTKTFISNGLLSDIIVVAAKTDPDPANAHSGISLFVVEADTPGFSRGNKLPKMGMLSQDTAELFFEECRVPAANRLGAEGAGFLMLMQNLQQERLVVAIGAQAAAESILEETIAYTQEREAFGRPISKFQNTRFKLAECATEVEVGRAFLDKLVQQHAAGEYLVKECSMAKLWQTEMGQRVADVCLQLFGGYGYMLEYNVSRAFMDARVQRIYAGTNEIMKIIISKQMGL